MAMPWPHALVFLEDLEFNSHVPTEALVHVVSWLQNCTRMLQPKLVIPGSNSLVCCLVQADLTRGRSSRQG